MSEFLAIIFSTVTAVAVIGWLLRVWIDKRLSYSLDLELERFRSELAKDVTRHSIQQQWMNDKRMQLLGDLYMLMVEMDFELKALFMNIKVHSKDFTTERANKVCTKYIELNAVLHKNAIFLSKEVIEEVRAAYKPYFDLAMNCMRGEDSEMEELKQLLPETLEEITAIADMPREHLVQAFRKVAGIDA
ncbi:MAG: hypothetical protein PHQ41_07810 [Candidatus Cloacimonetes bacterium]|nr:hypothetical protein [Candidatus Cloacimonadota bacterium]